MDRHKKKELGEYIDKAYNELLQSVKTFNGIDLSGIHNSLSSIIDALYLIRSELEVDQ